MIVIMNELLIVIMVDNWLVKLVQVIGKFYVGCDVVVVLSLGIIDVFNLVKC